MALTALILCAAAGLGPAPEPEEIAVAAGESFELRIGETARVEGHALALTFRDVTSDSRCPEGVQCVRAGEATVVLELDEDGQVSTLTLEVPPGGGATSRHEGRSIVLLGLDPPASPRRKLQRDEYVAAIRLDLE